MLTTEEIQGFQARLSRRAAEVRDELVQIAGGAKIVDLDQQVTGRLTRMDALQQQQMALESRRRLEREEIRIRAALDRVAARTYGVCAKCGQPIPKDRLDVAPEAPLCLPCFKSL